MWLKYYRGKRLVSAGHARGPSSCPRPCHGLSVTLHSHLGPGRPRHTCLLASEPVLNQSLIRPLARKLKTHNLWEKNLKTIVSEFRTEKVTRHDRRETWPR